ncbi:MAG: hypothetical protein QXK95_04470 [Nitrososphaerota archaeon]
MKPYQAFGSVIAVIFAMILFFTLASNPPIHVGWLRDTEDLIPQNLNLIGRAISTYLWENLYLAFLGLVLVVIVLALSIVVLLRRE